MSANCDVAIIGGGLVGCTLALVLQAQGRRVLQVEAHGHRPVEKQWDERCIALNAASVQILKHLDLWPDLADEVAPILSTHISERGRFGVARFAATDAGLDALGYNVPMRALTAMLEQRLKSTPGIERRVPARLTALALKPFHVEATLDDGSRIQCGLMVAADGADSSVRQLLGIADERRDYEQSAIVTAVRPSRDHGGVAWERFLDDGPIAVLPKPRDAQGHACSLVWTVARDDVERRMAQSDADFLRDAQEGFGERAGRFLALGRRQAYPLQRVMSERLVAPRVAFAGNAAQALHPVAAQGFNLGLRDVASLAEALEGVEDPGAEPVLKSYADRRSSDRARVAGFTDTLVRLFSSRLPGLRGLRHLGLLALDLNPAVREAVLWQNLGYSGHVPRMARRGELS